MFDGERWIGEVEDVAIDPAANRIAALIVAESGLWRRQRTVPWEEVVAVGTEGVQVQPKGEARSAADEQQDAVYWRLNDAEGAYGRDVYDEHGHHLGTVGDLLATPSDGRIVGCKLSDGILQDLLAGRRTIVGDLQLTGDGEALSVTWNSVYDPDST